jgi:hypothetical protein
MEETTTVANISREGFCGILWSCFAVATLFVFTRLALRWRQNRRFLADDYWIVLAYTAYIVMANLMALQLDPLWRILGEYGRFIELPDEETPADVRRLIRLLLPMLSMFWTVLWAVKASLLALFFPLVRRFRVQGPLWYCVAAVAILAYVGCWVSSILSCESSSYFFTKNCTCLRVLIKQAYSVVYSTAADVATDLMIMALPLTVLPSLQLDMRGKIGLGFVFSLGLVIIATAVARMTQVLSIARSPGDSVNVDCAALYGWTIVEATVALIVGSLPPFKGLMVRRVRKHLSGKKSSGQLVLLRGDEPSGPLWSVATSQSMPVEDEQRRIWPGGQIFVHTTVETFVEKHPGPLIIHDKQVRDTHKAQGV